MGIRIPVDYYCKNVRSVTTPYLAKPSMIVDVNSDSGQSILEITPLQFGNAFGMIQNFHISSFQFCNRHLVFAWRKEERSVTDGLAFLEKFKHMPGIAVPIPVVFKNVNDVWEIAVSVQNRRLQIVK